MTRRAGSIILSCIAIAALCGWYTLSARADHVDELVRAQMTRQKIPGAAVVVVRDGKVVKAAGYGKANVDLSAAVTPETVFVIQSISKQFTATGVMILVEEGKIQLDDPISRYIDRTPPAWEKITIRHLLGQTSGLKDFINDPTPTMRLNVTEAEIFESEIARPLNFEPGNAWEYSNTNAYLLAMIIQKVSGKWYGDFLAERIFKPLDMSSTAVMRDGDIVPNTAKGYVLENGTIKPGGPVGPAVVGHGGGGIRSTITDLAKWDAALYTDRIVKQETLKQMWTPVRLNNGTTHPYGFGWEIGQFGGHRRLSHGGNFTTGFSTQIERFVDDGLTVIILTNLYKAPAARIARAVAGTYLPAVAPPDYKPIPDNEPQVTARLRDLLQRSIDGNLRSEEFTPTTWEYFAPYREQWKTDMSKLAPIDKFTLVERTTTDDGQRSYRYQVQFRRTTLIMHFVVTSDDKISGIMPEEVNQ